MRKLLFKVLCILLIMLCTAMSMSFVVSSYSTYSYSQYAGDNVLLLNDENRIYLVAVNGNQVNIDRVYPDTYGVTLSLSSKVYSYNLYDNTVIMLSPDNANNQTTILLYDIATDTITSFNINSLVSSESTQMAYSNGYVYLVNGADILKYSSKGKLIQKYNFGSNSCYLMCNNTGVYSISYDGIYKLNDNVYEKVSNSAIHTAARFVSDDTFVTAFGYTNNYSGKIIDFKSTVDYPSGGVYKNNCIIADGNKIYSISKYDNEIKKYITLNSDIKQLYVIDSDVIALTLNNSTPTISVVPYSKLKDMPKDNNNNYSNLENKLYDISSDVYTINNDNMTISGIAPSTTVAVFKSNMYYDGYNVEFTRYGGKVITSGTVGTATVARFYNDTYSYEYELCVVGDITGEGNVNSRDKNTMFDYLLCNITFNGVFIDACNLDKSSNINTKDLVLLLRMIENQ